MGLEDRKRRAKKIADCPGKYKVCEGCGSIVIRAVNLCPNCNAYRFDEREEAIVRQAREIGNREAEAVVAEDLL